MKELFRITYEVLVYVSSITGLSYKEVNVVVWYIIIPLSWACLVDVIVNKHWFKLLFAASVALLLCFFDFSLTSEWVFDRSVDFLNSFNSVGSNYVSSSVIICLLVPILLYVALFSMAFIAIRSRRRRSKLESMARNA